MAKIQSECRTTKRKLITNPNKRKKHDEPIDTNANDFKRGINACAQIKIGFVLLAIGHFTVVCLVTWPWIGSELE